MFDTTCLLTVIKNTSGAAKVFSFLPPHGQELADDEEISFFGSILERISEGDRFGGRWRESLETALADGDLVIRALPKPVLLDETTDETKVLTLDDDAFVVDDPCWEMTVTP